MRVIIEPNTHEAFRNLNSQQPLSIPTWQQGEVRPLTVSLADLIASPASSRVMEPRSLVGWSLRAALGQGFIQPVAGIFTLTYDGEETDPIPYNATAQEIEDAINALPNIGTPVDVRGENGFFLVEFGIFDSVPELSSDGTGLAPLSIVDIGTLIDGTTEIKEVQTVRIFQNPAAYVPLNVASDPSDALPTLLQAGGGGNNAKYSLLLSPIPYDGRFTVSVDGEESDFIDFNASSSTLQLAIEGIGAVGEGNVSVAKTSEGNYIIGFKGALADTAVSLTADGSTLMAPPTLSGDLSLRNSAIDLLLSDNSSVGVIFEIEGTNPDGKIEKLFRSEGSLIFSIIGESSSEPPVGESWYTQGESDARFLQIADPASTTFQTGKALSTAAGSTFSVYGQIVLAPTSGTINFGSVAVTMPTFSVDSGKTLNIAPGGILDVNTGASLAVNGAVTGGASSAWDLSAVSALALPPDTLEEIGSVSAHQTSDLSKTASTTYSDLPGLSLAVVSGETWLVRAKILTKINGGGGAKVQITGGSPTAVGSSMTTVFFVGQKGTFDDQGLQVATSIGADNGYMEIEATITFGATGTMVVQAAQYAIDAGATVFRSGGSMLEAVRQ